MPKLLSIGECMIELAPTPEDTFSMGFAGDTFNTAWYARRIAGAEIDVAYLSAIGDDEPSGRLTQFMSDAGVIPELTVRTGASVGLYMISLKNGERSFSYWRSASAARSLADDLTNLPCKAGDIAFFSGITMAILPDAARTRFLGILSDARAAGIKVVFDPNLRPRLWTGTETMCHWVMEAARVSDVALPSFEDEQGFFNDTDITATADRYATAGASTVVVKDGPGPVLLRHDGRDQMIPPQPVASVVDTTAAGDSFNAGFLVGWMQGKPVDEAVAQGCALARQVIGARGALVPV
ncbi:MAG: sugar kinase [Paracoccaceae bacterium]